MEVVIMMRKTTLIFAALALVATVEAGQAQTVEFFVTIANLTDEKRPHAQVDVSIDTRAVANGPVAILFDVFRADGSLRTSFEVLTDQNGFASSSSAAPLNDNLFMGSDGFPELVRVRTPQSATSSAATLRQTLGKSEIVFDVPPLRRQDGTPLAVGRQFVVALGDIAPGATLLIANVSGADVNVDVFLGTLGVPGSGKYNNARLQNRTIWIVPFDQSDANSHVEIISSGDIVVQLAVEDAKKGITEGPLLPH